MGFGINFFPPADFIAAGNGETVLGFVAKGAKPKVIFSGNIVINEPKLLYLQPVIWALNSFARVAKTIIEFFRYSVLGTHHAHPPNRIVSRRVELLGSPHVCVSLRPSIGAAHGWF